MQREYQLEQLKTQVFDLLVIGGGATGSGIALDGATRGLKVALVERDDFASGTSSKSTKLIHGGVRYLELAVKKFDRSQLHLVRDALHERATLLKLAPHLTRPLSIVTPLYKWVEVPYYRIGLKMYDWLAGRSNLYPSRFMKAGEVRRQFPLLKSEKLRGGVAYYDGQFDDARMNVAIALTAEAEGAVILNHGEVRELLKEEKKICGARIKDLIGGGEFPVKARVVINATGPFVDGIRKMDDPSVPPMLTASSGVHIVLDRRYSPPETGLLIPKTEDGRVLFLLPWLGHTLVGTTDNPAPIEPNPQATEEEIQYILRHVAKYFEAPIGRQDVLSAWSGLRPLVSNPKAADTARLSRDHVIQVSPSGLITIAGGKWTTYRRMALDTVEQAIRLGHLQGGPSRTETTLLVGARKFTSDLPLELEKKFHLSSEVAEHLSRSYGDRAEKVALLSGNGGGRRLVGTHPYLESEILYGVREEGAQTALDVLARRTRLAFLDKAAARAALPRVVELMAGELKWDTARQKKELDSAMNYLK